MTSLDESARPPRREKVLLMGKQKSGKTSMRSIIFANLVAKETISLAPTLNIDHNYENFLGALRLNMWDCAGQTTYFKEHLTTQKHLIFDRVRVLIYVFDFFRNWNRREMIADIHQFRQVVEVMKEISPKAHLFVLVHKMDLVPEHMNNVFLNPRKIYSRKTRWAYHL